LLGSLFEVGAFVERKEITTVNKSEDIRARLLSVLGSHAVDVEAKPAASVDDSAASLLAELQAMPSESSQPEPHPEGAPPFGHGPEGLYTHTVSDIESAKNPEDGFDSP
jgi:hypothetical protein